ncbi:hypothetical protein GCM10018793_31510 [Streptomyces sulfonofaciens]|uniref:OmpR/PhoB-type domain-containing protein n=1 Tax=Streptomyces sulfonofaciens TaxID=68272 RepID=A0A919G8J1_9ACTN|nr:BTAD domain-containing putative transcriptional regulator [Streptomyces sulfonofaciens]GHH79230.1 hypothetical protein GCM10018793_31510 [Streptomyces sulfonofaciens]
MHNQQTSIGNVPGDRWPSSTAPTRLQTPAISVFGPLSVVLDGHTVQLGPPRQRAVLAVLLIEVGRVVPVPAMVDRLWGSEPPQQALASLHSYVSRLRKLLSSWPLPSGSRLKIRYQPPGYVLVAPAEEIDAARFERLADEGHRAARDADHALAFHLFGAALSTWTAPPFEELAEYAFASQESIRLGHVRLSVIQQRAEMAFVLGLDSVTLPELESEVNRNPLEEGLVRLLMRAQYRMGRQADALRTFERTRRVLAKELGVDPSLPLQRMHADILRHDPALHPSQEPPAAEPKPLLLAGTNQAPEPTGNPDVRTFVGRQDELRALVAAQPVTWSRSGRTAVILGEAGIGKTSLLQRFTAMAKTNDAITVQCPDMQGMPAFWPWSRILRRALEVRPRFMQSLSDEIRRVLGHLVPELAPDSENVPEWRANATPSAFEFHDAITRALAVLGQSPLVLVLENFHWADPSSWAVLRFLAGQMAGSHLILLVSLRTFLPAHDPNLRKTLAALLQQPGVEVIRLGGLSRPETATLAATVSPHTGKPDGEIVAALHERTHGNPSFVLGLARGLSDRTTPDDVRLMIPDSVREIILERIGSLPDDVRAVLDMASVLAEGTPRAVLEDMIDQAGIMVEAIRLAQRGDLLRPQTAAGGSIRFEHSLIRDVVRQELSEEAAVAIHRRAVRSLVRRMSPEPDSFAASVTAHAQAALRRLPPQDVLAPLIAEADRLARSFAYEPALRCLELASSLLADHDESGCAGFHLDLLARQADIATLVHGTGARATMAIYDRMDRLTRLLRRAQSPVSRVGRCLGMLCQGRFAHAEAMLTCGPGPSWSAGEGADAVILHYVRGVRLYSRAHFHDALAEFNRALAAGVPGTPRLHGCRVHIALRCWQAVSLWHCGARGAARQLVRRLQDIITADQSVVPAERLATLYVAAMLAVLDGKARQALATAQPALRLAENTGSRIWQANLTLLLAWARVRTGDDGDQVFEAARTALVTTRRSGFVLIRMLHLHLLADMEKATRRSGHMERVLHRVPTLATGSGGFCRTSFRDSGS